MSAVALEEKLARIVSNLEHGGLADDDVFLLHIVVKAAFRLLDGCAEYEESASVYISSVKRFRDAVTRAYRRLPHMTDDAPRNAADRALLATMAATIATRMCERQEGGFVDRWAMRPEDAVAEARAILAVVDARSGVTS